MQTAINNQEKVPVFASPTMPELLQLLEEKDQALEQKDKVLESKDQLIEERNRLIAEQQKPLKVAVPGGLL